MTLERRHARAPDAIVTAPSRAQLTVGQPGSPESATPLEAEILELQRLAGNAAVTRALSATPVVQRHSSYEHAILGDVKPADVKSAHLGADTTAEAWRHILEEELNRVLAFKSDPAYDPTHDYPQVRWVRLGTSRLWVSPGELSAMGDYLPNPETIDTMPAKQLIPVLQRMRQIIARSLYSRLDLGGSELSRNRETRMKGAVKGDAEEALLHNPLRDISADAAEVSDLDKATAGLGPNRQKGLLARNACHFAPSSWERWSLYHNEARGLAREAHAEPRRMTLQMRSRQPMRDAERRAWVANGYSNHFLQDSFAAGHLINKTLVMQWFAEYTKQLGWWSRPHYGLPDRDVLEAMSPTRQPDIANRRAYTKTRLGTSATQDRLSGNVTTDPQTTLERFDNEGRLAGTGLRSRDPEAGKEYGQLEQFFNSSFLNLAAGEVHDYFNRTGLLVTNAAGQQFQVGGDSSMLRIQSEEAIGVALRANTLADQAITEILATGETTIDVKQVFDLFPSAVVVDGKAVPLERWNDRFVKAYARKEIFPDMAKRIDYKVVRMFGKRLLDSGKVLTPAD